MSLLGREEINSFMFKAAILSTGELELNSAFTWSSHTMPAVWRRMLFSAGCQNTFTLLIAVLNLQGSFYTVPQVPAARQHCAAWHFHLAAPLCLLLPWDATLQTCSTKKRVKLPFVTGFSDYIWTSTWITALFYLCMYVKMDFFFPTFVSTFHLTFALGISSVYFLLSSLILLSVLK